MALLHEGHEGVQLSNFVYDMKTFLQPYVLLSVPCPALPNVIRHVHRAFRTGQTKAEKGGGDNGHEHPMHQLWHFQSQTDCAERRRLRRCGAVARNGRGREHDIPWGSDGQVKAKLRRWIVGIMCDSWLPLDLCLCPFCYGREGFFSPSTFHNKSIGLGAFF